MHSSSLPSRSDVPLPIAPDSGPALPGRAPLLVLAAVVVLFAVGFSWLAVMRHDAFQSHAFDLGNMDQAVWATLHGHLLRFTDMQVGDHVLTNRFAIHVEPILIPIALLYLLHPGPETLLILQALVVASGAIPAYLLARGLGRWIALVFPLAYLLHPSLQNAVLDDFHAVTLTAALLLWAVYFLRSENWRWFLTMVVLAAATKEEVSLVIAALGVAVALRRRRLGVALIVGGIAWFLISIVVIIPHFNPGGHSPYLARYAYLGRGLFGVVRGILTQPQLVIRVLTTPPHVNILDVLLDPLGFVALLGLPWLLPALPAVLIDMLSADPTMYSGYYQYAAEIVPFLIVAAIAGIAASGRLARGHVSGGRAVVPVLAVLVLVASIVSDRLYGFSPLASGYTIPGVGPHQALESRLLRLIPPGAVVAAADEIEPHLSDRPTIYLLPTLHPRNGPAARYIALDASIPALPTEPHTLHRTAVYALHHGYGVIAARDGILILRQGATRRNLPPSFYSFIFQRGSHVTPIHAAWGNLHLVGVTVHPSNRLVNRSRPAIEVESYWRRTGPVHGSIRVYLSPVYQHRPPPLSRWSVSTDSPTWDWLPIGRWPKERVIHVASLPLLPDTYRSGWVRVAISVVPSPHATWSTRAITVATVRVAPSY